MAQRTKPLTVSLVLVAIVAALAFVQIARAHQAPAVSGRTIPRILFICPHGAAKSVLASAYFQRMAKERGLNVMVDFAGTEPDRAVAPKVAERLKARGYPPPTSQPRRVTPEDVASADMVISIGCDLAGLSPATGALRRWDDVPAPSEDFDGADDAILKRVTELVEELAHGSKR
jgi:arsenate reductase